MLDWNVATDLDQDSHACMDTVGYHHIKSLQHRISKFPDDSSFSNQGASILRIEIRLELYSLTCQNPPWWLYEAVFHW